MSKDYKLIDVLIDKGLPFAIYKSPDIDDIQFVTQVEGCPLLFDDISKSEGHEGFIAVNFSGDKVILIKDDIKLSGETAIFRYLKDINCLSNSSADTNFDTYNTEDDLERYSNAYKSIHSIVQNGECSKIVLSRKKSIKKTGNFSAGNSFKLALEKYPDAFVCLFNTNISSTWLVISPEKILSGKDNLWKTVSLAGTMVQPQNNKDIIWDKKNIKEQEIVSDYIASLLSDNNIQFTTNGPFTSNAGNLVHLKTEFSMSGSNSFDLTAILKALHPTPAVCGFPREKAMNAIRLFEGYERNFYSGFSGIISKNETTSLYVNLRCMQIGAKTLDLYSGGGILSDSELFSEWNETEAKMQTILSIIEV